MDWLIFVAFTVLVNIVTLNLLIAIISNTYDKVQDAMNVFHIKTKANILLEIASVMNSFEEDYDDLVYLYIFHNSNDKLTQSNENEWEGRVKLIQKKIDRLGNDLKTNQNELMKFLKDENQNIRDEMKENQLEVQQDVKFMKDDISIIKNSLKQIIN